MNMLHLVMLAAMAGGTAVTHMRPMGSPSHRAAVRDPIRPNPRPAPHSAGTRRQPPPRMQPIKPVPVHPGGPGG